MHEVLAKKFIVYGLFHEWNGQDFNKRAVLEILRSDTPASNALPHDFLQRRPDVCVVMMNPGSSAPLPGFGQAQDEGRLIPAKPDRVQHQIMRLMAMMDWQHARIVNLADIRAAKSADLYRLIESGADSRQLGCLFAGQSQVKPEQVVTAPLALCAWGLDARLAPWAQQAQDWIESRRLDIYGLRVESLTHPAYRYPKPVGNWAAAVTWLNTVYQSLRP
jgi:hypothetical protein